MDYFKNVDKQVERTRTGKTILHEGYLSNSVIKVPVEEGFKSSSVLKKKKEKEIEAKTKAKEKSQTLAKKFEKGRIEKEKKVATFNKKLSELPKKGKTKVLKRVLTEMYLDSLYIDDDFKLENFNNIANIVENYVDTNGGYTLIENAYLSNNSVLLKKIMELCEETSKKACKRIAEETSETKDHEQLDFELNDDEVKEFDYRKGEIGLDQISNVVKDKVLAVVKEEQKREAKLSEMMEDIETELSEDKSITDEKSVKEALQKIFVQASPTEEGTLFNSLLRTSYKSVIEGKDVLFQYNTLTEAVEEDEDVFLSNLSIDDVELEEDIYSYDLPDNDELLDDDLSEIFEENANDILNSIDNDDIDTLEEALKDMAEKIKKKVKSTKSKKKASNMKKDIRKIQDGTEELADEACKSTKEGCKKKAAIESFIDNLEESVDVLDYILEAHLNAEIEVMESITESKNGKTFVKPLASKKDGKLKDVKFMYKLKAIEKEIEKIAKNIKSERSGNKAMQLVEKNMKVLENLKSNITEPNKLSAISKLTSKLEKLKKDLSKKVKTLKENHMFEDEIDYDLIDLEDVKEGCFQEDIDFEDEEDEFEDDEPVNETINMDMILTEAIAKYTMLELSHTINLSKYNSARVRTMANSLLNKK